MNVLFIVQGEGRGHMTQALALAEILRGAGHRVSAALVGRSRRRELPSFFTQKIGAPVYQFESPNFVTDPGNKAVRIFPTVWNAARRFARFRESLSIIGAHLRLRRPDLVVNFYEPLAGLYYGRYGCTVPMACVGHQYMVYHPSFPFPAGQSIDRWSLTRFTDLTAIGSVRCLGLSFRPLPGVPEHSLTVVPPLLRSALFDQPLDVREPFFLIYLLNAGLAEGIVNWHERRRDVTLHCFWDNKEAPEVYAAAPNLVFHRLADVNFLSMMARCSGLICTAGFESVCEAMYLGKPVMMVPVAGHYEQQCNAVDAERAGAGIRSTAFDIDRFLDVVPSFRSPTESFRVWAESAPSLFLAELEAAAGGHSSRSRGVEQEAEYAEADSHRQHLVEARPRERVLTYAEFPDTWPCPRKMVSIPGVLP